MEYLCGCGNSSWRELPILHTQLPQSVPRSQPPTEPMRKVPRVVISDFLLNSLFKLESSYHPTCQTEWYHCKGHNIIFLFSSVLDREALVCASHPPLHSPPPSLHISETHRFFHPYWITLNTIILRWKKGEVVTRASSWISYNTSLFTVLET